MAGPPEVCYRAALAADAMRGLKGGNFWIMEQITGTPVSGEIVLEGYGVAVIRLQACANYLAAARPLRQCSVEEVSRLARRRQSAERT